MHSVVVRYVYTTISVKQRTIGFQKKHFPKRGNRITLIKCMRKGMIIFGLTLMLTI